MKNIKEAHERGLKIDLESNPNSVRVLDENGNEYRQEGGSVLLIDMEELINSDYNWCDRCGRIAFSESLNWVASEGFETKEGEELKKEMIREEEYSAVCHLCYPSVVLTN